MASRLACSSAFCQLNGSLQSQYEIYLSPIQARQSSSENLREPKQVSLCLKKDDSRLWKLASVRDTNVPDTHLDNKRRNWENESIFLTVM